MSIRTAQAVWTGDFREGQGTITPGSGNFEAGYTYGSIFQGEPGSNPIEILGASLAGCFTGGLAALISRDNFAPKSICTDATVHIDVVGKGYSIAKIHLHAKAEVPGLDAEKLTAYAEMMSKSCPVAQALGAIEITVQADLI